MVNRVKNNRVKNNRKTGGSVINTSTLVDSPIITGLSTPMPITLMSTAPMSYAPTIFENIDGLNKMGNSLTLYSDSEFPEGDTIDNVDNNNNIQKFSSKKISNNKGISGADDSGKYMVIDSKRSTDNKILVNGKSLGLTVIDKKKIPADLESVILLPNDSGDSVDKIFVLGSRGQYAEINVSGENGNVTSNGNIELHIDLENIKKTHGEHSINIESSFYNSKLKLIGYVQRDGILSGNNYYLNMDYTGSDRVDNNVRPIATDGVRVAEVKVLGDNDISLYAIENSNDSSPSRGSNKLIISRLGEIIIQSRWSLRALHKYEAFSTTVTDTDTAGINLIMNKFNINQKYNIAELSELSDKEQSKIRNEYNKIISQFEYNKFKTLPILSKTNKTKSHEHKLVDFSKIKLKICRYVDNGNNVTEYSSSTFGNLIALININGNVITHTGWGINNEYLNKTINDTNANITIDGTFISNIDKLEINKNRHLELNSHKSQEAIRFLSELIKIMVPSWIGSLIPYSIPFFAKGHKSNARIRKRKGIKKRENPIITHKSRNITSKINKISRRRTHMRGRKSKGRKSKGRRDIK